MTKFQKLKQQFVQNPTSVSCPKIEILLQKLGFEKLEGSGGHKKFKHPLTTLILSPHNREIPNYQKKYVLKSLLNHKLLS